MTSNPYTKIKSNSIMTASPQELTLMLYDGAIKFGNQAKVAMVEKDIEKSHNLIMRVLAIIEEFQITLDKSYEVAVGLELMYDYISRRLMEANASKDPEILEEAIGFIRDLRNTWKEAMQLTKQGNTGSENSLNLTTKAQ
ncbi:flagellar export chaperone FliS [Petrocella sp. FN5]|uniref:flagellar export chaperone FliS n=1 Tax=Petrocella sp. FN5 TaxID=3032002 RepID=UPI0023D99455|nr:flagellar export chaperone FliS [Petrocella sp. FN5]MDF1615997.1 flagellar export chaperone FliS [Petrocella sp. FN5]